MYWGCYINTLRQIPIKPWVIEKQYPSSKHVLFSTNILYSILPGATLEDQQQQFLTLSPAAVPGEDGWQQRASLLTVSCVAICLSVWVCVGGSLCGSLNLWSPGGSYPGEGSCNSWWHDPSPFTSPVLIPTHKVLPSATEATANVLQIVLTSNSFGESVLKTATQVTSILSLKGISDCQTMSRPPIP